MSAGRLLRAALLAVAWASAANAAPAALPQPTPAQSPSASGDGVPRGAMQEYLALARGGDYTAAARLLDLSGMGPGERLVRGPLLARQLKVVIERTREIDLDALSDRPEGLENDGLPPDRDRIGTVRSRGGPADLLLARVRETDGAQVWRVASSTVKRIPELYDQHGYPAFVDRLPREFVDWQVLGTDLWQWIGLFLLAAAAWGLGFSVAWAARRLVLLLVRRTTTDLDDRIADEVHRPLRLTITLYLFLAGSYWLQLAVAAQDFLLRASRGLTVLLATWICLRIVDIVSRSAQERMVREDRRAAVSMITLGRRAAKVLIVALGVLGILQNLGFNVTGLVAGLGIGGVAVALAAQKTLENVFGGVVMTADRPIRVGDFCRFGETQGTVMDVGLRSTRVRTLDGTVVSVPNAEMATVRIENFTVRDRFRLHAVLGLRYETPPAQVRVLVARVGEMLAAHPKVMQEGLRVRLSGFGASSLDVEVLANVGTTDIDEFAAVREELLLGIMELVSEAGTGFAFPSQTLYLARDRGVDRPG